MTERRTGPATARVVILGWLVEVVGAGVVATVVGAVVGVVVTVVVDAAVVGVAVGGWLAVV